MDASMALCRTMACATIAPAEESVVGVCATHGRAVAESTANATAMRDGRSIVA